ncbi:hypothetical protein Q4Y15_001698 [Campylobacter fetus]|uniref:Uncharacterized protein n=4 Tax=Campylobacter fetus TaxID=196 RepID=A0A5L8KNQ2_CAMFE|nr:hypothetical protein [Campylobacter fetus]OCS20369.1 hypothetical protein CFVI97532_10035 [Campylobacter fetus subsp. venerealis cfvi97/532]OCS25306.1 hypothetical protein CFVB10_09125 [Campylobacter fetus subsp. venerealis cfvB10]OCS30513.1 hypothetical protein CFVLMG6570_08875 [Campylobacter fetus subsp. venerealis LMG 6570 = CCUG 33900]ABK81739.1 hypothetical protein CFF8240_0653 [Campylobacter fetus subsp. fetus 82-40]AIR79009.1 hypothetical protein CFF04554_1115 [Campylobacter fetus su
MEFEKLKESLEARAKASLLNPNEITAEALEFSTNETLEFCKGKEVQSWAVMDFAMTRLKIYLKIELSEADIILLKNACKEIDASKIIEGKGGGLLWAAV